MEVETKPLPIIVAVAITGAVPRKEQNPAIPISPSEQVESTHAAYEAGAALVHVHVRNADQSPSSNPEIFSAVMRGIQRYCPGMIVQFSTGGRGRDPGERGSALFLRPDMASLATGSVNFATQVYENHPDLIKYLANQMKRFGVRPEIEVFDLSMLYAARNLVDEGLIPSDPHVQFVLGIPNALPGRRNVLEFMISELQVLLPNATWCAAGIGRHQLEVNKWCLELGGHTRTGLEDNLKYDQNRLAKSNAELVVRIVALCEQYHRVPASAEVARSILHLSADT
jgi:3-keto-5-aminohexanoate cleavage enzyme